MVLAINAKAMHHLKKSNDASPAEHKWDREAVDKSGIYIIPELIGNLVVSFMLQLYSK